MNNKTIQLDELFDRWQNSNVDQKNAFKRDGINDEQKFENGKPKILFITKEPNDPKQEEGDYRKWWKSEIKYSFSIRIAEWSYGILNGFPEYDVVRRDLNGLLNALHSVAFMNIKKIGGKGISNDEVILETLKRDYKFIQDEIRIIEPDIIITGLSVKPIREELFKTIKWHESGYSIAIGKHNGVKVIDFYHPSSRTAPAASYSLLEKVITSKAFKQL